MYPVLFARKGPILAFSAVKGPFLALNARNRALILGAGRVRAGVYSALPVDRIPTPDQRPRFAEQLGDVLRPHGPFVEQVRVTILTGRTGSGR